MPFTPFAALCRQLGTKARKQRGNDDENESDGSSSSSGNGGAFATSKQLPLARVDSLEEARQRITLRRCSLENSGQLHKRSALEHDELHTALPREDSLTLARRRFSTEVATTTGGGAASSHAAGSSAGSLLNGATATMVSDASCSGALGATAWEALADACAARHLVRFSSDVSDALSSPPQLA